MAQTGMNPGGAVKKASGAQPRKYRSYDYDIDDLIRAESDPEFEAFVQRRRAQERLQEQESARHHLMREQEEAQAEAARREQKLERLRAAEAEKLQSRLEAQHVQEQTAYESQQEKLREQFVVERDVSGPGRSAPLRMPAALQRVIRANESVQ